MISARKIAEIKKLGIKIDHQMAFGGKSKGNKHLIRAVAVAKHLAQVLKADLAIVESGAWLHDTALPSGNDYDYKKNKKIVLSLLSAIDISNEDKMLIAECVASREGTKNPVTLESKIVHDADVLEKTGLLGIIRHTWKMTNSKKINPARVTDKNAKDVIDHIKWRNKKLQTPFARKIAKYLTVTIKTKQAKEIITIIAQLAAQGIITEKIAVVLRKYLTFEQNKKLQEQLNLSYLKKF